MKYLQIVT